MWLRLTLDQLRRQSSCILPPRQGDRRHLHIGPLLVPMRRGPCIVHSPFSCLPESTSPTSASPILVSLQEMKGYERRNADRRARGKSSVPESIDMHE